MNLTPEQISAAHKTNLETLSSLTNQALQSIEKLVELNIHIAKQTLGDGMTSAKKALEVKDIQQLLAHQADAVQPMAEKIMAYNRHLYALAHETQANFTESAEKELQDGQRKMNTLVMNWTNVVAPGSEASDNVMKQAEQPSKTKPGNAVKPVKKTANKTNKSTSKKVVSSKK